MDGPATANAWDDVGDVGADSDANLDDGGAIFGSGLSAINDVAEGDSIWTSTPLLVGDADADAGDADKIVR